MSSYVLSRAASPIRILIRRICPSICRTNTTYTAPCGTDPKESRGLILGVYSYDGNGREERPRFTKAGQKYDDLTCGRLGDILRQAGPIPENGDLRIIYDLTEEFTSVAVVGLGKECLGYNDVEERDEGKEGIRRAAATGCRALQRQDVIRIFIEGFGSTESAAEGAGLGLWLYQELRNPEKQIRIPQLDLYDDCDWTGWQIGLQKAAAQNLARQIMATPANLMTPTMFAQNAVEVLTKSGINVEVKVKGWAETQKMGAFLAVAKGSCEAPIFLELSYYGAPNEERPIVLVGSGVCFDSGGVCLKKSKQMANMRGDLSGAACVLATTRALAALQLPINVRSLIPLCENMPGCAAMKPGDIVTAMSGKTIAIEDTRNEGRLCLADTLFYSQNFWPKFVVDVGSLCPSTYKTLGSAATPVFTNSDELWGKLQMAGVHTGDRMWRFPLWDFYTRQVTARKDVDLSNKGEGRGGDHCKAAAFLREFVPCGEWIHLDTYATMMSGSEFPYLRKGEMSGRPTRTLIEFISQMACKPCD